MPSEDQKAFADYLGKRWGENVKFNYFAIVTNPRPKLAYVLTRNRKPRSKSPAAIAYYSPLTKGYINEAIPRTAKVLPMGSS